MKAALAMDAGSVGDGTAAPEGGLFGTEATWVDPSGGSGLVAFTSETGRIGILDADEWLRISSKEEDDGDRVRDGIVGDDDVVPFTTSMGSIAHQRTGSRDMLLSSSGSLARLLDAATRDMPVAGHVSSDLWWTRGPCDDLTAPPLDHDVPLDGLDQAWLDPFPGSPGAEDPTWGSGESFGLGDLHHGASAASGFAAAARQPEPDPAVVGSQRVLHKSRPSHNG